MIISIQRIVSKSGGFLAC